jgi:hypothetical protein
MPVLFRRIGQTMKQPTSSFLCVALCAAALVLSGAAAFAQAEKDEAKTEAKSENTDLFGDIGRWFDRSISSIGDQFKSAGKNIDQFNHEAGVAAKTTAGAAVDAADQAASLAKTRVVNGRQNCPISPNGAPDCNAAADRLCRAKGLKSGTSLDVTSARECPTRALLQKDARAECKDVTFVTRAMCR